jgi:hypothetical protein
MLIRCRWSALLLALLLLAACWPISLNLSFDRSIENMFAHDDPVLPPFRRVKELFNGNEIVLVAYQDDQLLTPAGYQRLSELNDRLAAIPGVRTTISISRTPLKEAIVGDQPAVRNMRALFEGFCIAPSSLPHGEGTTAVVCMLEADQADDARQRTIDTIRAHAVREEAVVVGEPVMVTDGFRFVSEDGDTLGRATLVLLSLTILLCFRSLRWTLIPLAVILVTLVLTRGLLVVSQIQLSMVSSMLTAIVTVIAVATVVHVIVRFREARTNGVSPMRALAMAGRVLAVPIALACATDAVGFAALLRARVGPVQDFGLMMAVGSLVVIASVALVVPALALAGRFDVDPRRAWGERRLEAGLNGLVNLLLARPKTITFAAAAVGAFVAAGSVKLDVETNFTKNFRAYSEIARSYQFVESHLGGAGVMDVLIEVTPELDEKFIERLRGLDRQLQRDVVGEQAHRKRWHLSAVLSVADVLDAVRPGELLELISAEQLAEALSVEEVLDEVSVEELLKTIEPEKLPPPLGAMAKFTPADLLEPLVRKIPTQTFLAIIPPKQLDALWDKLSVELKLRVMRRIVPELINSLVTPDNRYVRIMLRAHEQASSRHKTETIQQIRATTSEVFPGDSGEVEVTGFYVLLTRLVESMIADQWICFAWALAGIGLMMLIAFRSPRLALIALVPNAVPIVMVMGVMGWLGIKINMGAAMIAAVSMGLSIDSSIHYLSAYRRERLRGVSMRDALHTVHQRVGRALVFATLALVIGFAALCGSQFVPTIYFGALVSLSMLGGLIGNLVVLPVLLILTKA